MAEMILAGVVVALVALLAYEKYTTVQIVDTMIRRNIALAKQLDVLRGEIYKLNSELVVLVKENNQLHVEVQLLSNEVARLRDGMERSFKGEHTNA